MTDFVVKDNGKSNIQRDKELFSEQETDLGKQLYEKSEICCNEGNIKEAWNLLKQAAEQGNIDAQYEVGASYFKGIYKFAILGRDYSKAFYWLKKAAERGSIPAQSPLSLCYIQGLGTNVNIKEGIKCLKIAAADGGVLAKIDLLDILENENPVEAFQYGLNFAMQGLSLAQKKLAEFYHNGTGVERDEVKAIYWLNKYAEQCDDTYQYNVAYSYENGLGIGQNYYEALKIYSRLAEKGFAPAQCCLGLFYEKGYGVKKDGAKAFYWCEKAAKQGNAAGLCDIGVFYENGIGVKQNYKKAIECYRMSCAKDFTNAYYNLGCCYSRGLGVKENDKQATKLFQKAAERGHLNAQFNLAFNYEKGYGVKKDKNKAIYWYQKAAEQGDLESQEKIFRLKQLSVPKPVINSYTLYGKTPESISYSLYDGQEEIGTNIQSEEKEQSIIEKQRDLVDAGVEAKHFGDYEKAIELYKEVIKLSPEEGNSYYALGKILYLGKHYDQAFRAYILAYLHDAHCYTSDLFIHAGHAILDDENSKNPKYISIIQDYVASVQGEKPLETGKDYRIYESLCKDKGKEEIIRQAKIFSRG